MSTRPRSYFSARTGKNPDAAKLTFDAFKSLFLSGYKYMESEGYFVEHFGYWCVDDGEVPGRAGGDPCNYVMFHLRRDALWPIHSQIALYDENDLFDIIEFLFDHVSKGVSGYHHTYSDCGMHWNKFDREAGQQFYRDKLNPLLECYGPGYELTDRGEIMEIGPDGLKHLLAAKPRLKDASVSERIQNAVDRFRRHGSNLDDRRKVVRDLADVLEWLRPQIKLTLLKKDEGDLFNLANNFGIRHFNEEQKNEYDPAVWLSWMFYYYLATIHACLHLMERQEVKVRSQRSAT